MPSEIVWLPSAAKDVSRLRDFIQSNNPSAAVRAANRIKDASKILKENPEAGRPVEELFPFRELFIPFGSGNYILRYRVVDTRVIIVSVKHSREDDD
ncbi:MAG: type II toxin-antitoxin system RelE/ParE family toxin [Gammaproteobacteria bacterium]|nr:type II toxin-antitoxin system RelE/ParE family toxin [Gammaproteobacteria bacterium]